ncbi:hypothetical protein CcCBS67573_g04457 [Chytriomyces confervae]|uniref:Amino acid permease/ SLC12A domain-containing protein n=1 Tax=Chytriomyces confervae TaxID=246404 RepID=A0A507FG79_9FUNG|nr:hypothetical protein CcCBS67573_g04457 [Chytriomyces confervae]
MNYMNSGHEASSMNPLKDMINLRNKDFVKKRRLMKPFATWIHIWGFVTGAVISGEFSGFNGGYSYGLGSMIVAHTLFSILMISVSMNLLELTIAMPFASGCAAWAKAAFGGPVGCLIGLAYTLDMVFIGANVTLFLGTTLTSISSNLSSPILNWLVTMGFCWLLNLHPKVFFNVITALSAVSIVLVFAPLIACWGQFDLSLAWETLLPNGTISNAYFPFGLDGISKSAPLALYLLVCFESLPVAVEETKDASFSLKWGMLTANLTLLVASWTVLIICAGMKPGSVALSAVSFPYTLILTKAFPDAHPQLINIINIPAIFASQLATFYASSRHIYGLSRSGYLPRFCSLTNRWGSPWVALLITCILWFTFSLLLQFIPNSNTMTIFFALGTLFAMTAYLIQPLVYLKLHFHLPSLPRPFKVPFGLGPCFAGMNFLIAVVGILGMVSSGAVWTWSALGIFAGYAFVTPFYFFVIQHNLEKSPEKIFIKEQLKVRADESLISESSGRESKSLEAWKNLMQGTEDVSRRSDAVNTDRHHNRRGISISVTSFARKTSIASSTLQQQQQLQQPPAVKKGTKDAVDIQDNIQALWG